MNHTMSHTADPTHLWDDTGRVQPISRRTDWDRKEKKNNIHKRFIIKAQDSFPLETDGQAKAFGII